MFVNDRRYGRLFDETYKITPGVYKLIANYIASDVAGFVSSFGDSVLENITPEKLAQVIEMAFKNEISSRGAKDILKILAEKGGDPREIVEREGLFQKSGEGELKVIVEKIIAENEKVVAEYQAGKTASLQFLVGQGMRASRGSANPEILKKLFTELLS